MSPSIDVYILGTAIFSSGSVQQHPRGDIVHFGFRFNLDTVFQCRIYQSLDIIRDHKISPVKQGQYPGTFKQRDTGARTGTTQHVRVIPQAVNNGNNIFIDQRRDMHLPGLRLDFPDFFSCNNRVNIMIIDIVDITEYLLFLF